MNDLEKEIFETVYQWGRVGVMTDHTAPTYQKLIESLLVEARDEGARDLWQALKLYTAVINQSQGELVLTLVDRANKWFSDQENN